jgi:hypothetical protein
MSLSGGMFILDYNSGICACLILVSMICAYHIYIPSLHVFFLLCPVHVFFSLLYVSYYVVLYFIYSIGASFTSSSSSSSSSSASSAMFSNSTKIADAAARMVRSRTSYREFCVLAERNPKSSSSAKTSKQGSGMMVAHMSFSLLFCSC